jgi:hypothetical protein
MICAIHGRELSLRLLAGRWELAAAGPQIVFEMTFIIK